MAGFPNRAISKVSGCGTSSSSTGRWTACSGSVAVLFEALNHGHDREKIYRIQLDGYRDGRTVSSTCSSMAGSIGSPLQDRKAAEAEAAQRYKKFTAAREEKRKAEAAPGPHTAAQTRQRHAAQGGRALSKSYTYGLYKPLTMKQHAAA